jgi:predicted MPP superfamily phosphohydrolase
LAEICGAGYAVTMRPRTRLALILALAAVALFAWMHHVARADPIVRRATVHLPDWPNGQAPLRVLLLSDIHIGNAAMDPARLTRIVDQANALKPDLVVIAGDFVHGLDERDGRIYAAQLVAPLSRLHAPLGVVAVAGNHDYWAAHDSLAPALQRTGVALLANAATRRGPLAIGGIADGNKSHEDVVATMAALDRLPGVRLVIGHYPDLSPNLPASVHLMLAGHTHCGQIVLPYYGPLSRIARARYACGWVRDPGRLTLTTAGLGTSLLPLRLGAWPDMWLLTLEGRATAPFPSRRAVLRRGDAPPDPPVADRRPASGRAAYLDAS